MISARQASLSRVPLPMSAGRTSTTTVSPARRATASATKAIEWRRETVLEAQFVAVVLVAGLDPIKSLEGSVGGCHRNASLSRAPATR